MKFCHQVIRTYDPISNFATASNLKSTTAKGKNGRIIEIFKHERKQQVIKHFFFKLDIVQAVLSGIFSIVITVHTYIRKLSSSLPYIFGTFNSFLASLRRNHDYKPVWSSSAKQTTDLRAYCSNMIYCTVIGIESLTYVRQL